MTYNIHPILVHFPIAFLFLYSVVKILPWQKWLPLVSWKHIERMLLLAGMLGAFAANTTGELAEELVRVDRQTVEMHSFFAAASLWLYGLLLIGEILTVVIPVLSARLNSVQISQFLSFFEKILTHKILSKLLAFLGLLAITLTGLLGGVLVYGTSADPLAAPVLKLLGI